MPSFYNAERNYVVSTSLKVMYTSLTQQPSLRPLSSDLRAALRVWLTPGLRRYLLVRDPYERLVSFHADKLREALDKGETGTWQHCQRILFPGLGLSGSEGAAVIAERLRGVTFGEFVALLPRVFRKDPHLWPQSWSRAFRVRGVALPGRVDRVLQIETDVDVLVRLLGLDVSIRVNATEHASAERSFTAASYEVANDIYRDDFAGFGYPMRGTG